MAADSRNGNGLRAVLEANSPGGRGWLGRMTVLAPGNDPFRADTDSGHRNGAWLAEQVREFGLGDGTIHLRGIHYALVDRHTRRPDTLEPYENNDSNWTWLQGTCGKQARWLGYVGFDQIHDERNAEPVVRIYKEIDPVPHLNVGLEVEIPDAEDLVPTVGIEGFTGKATVQARLPRREVVA